MKLTVEEVKQLFDLVVGSMDFGSGFLDTDDVNLLRRVAVHLGADPMVATPTEFTRTYPHAPAPYPEPRMAHLEGQCRHCYYGPATGIAWHMEPEEYATYCQTLIGGDSQ